VFAGCGTIPTAQLAHPLVHSPLTLSCCSILQKALHRSATKSCSTTTVLRSAATVGFLCWPPTSLVPPPPESVIHGAPWPAAAPSCSPGRSAATTCPVYAKAAMSPSRSIDDAKLHRRARRNSGQLHFGCRPIVPHGHSAAAPAQSAPRLRCLLACPPTTQSSIAGLEEKERGSAPAAALDSYRAPWLVGPRHRRALDR
jgi:hypothetical protein